MAFFVCYNDVMVALKKWKVDELLAIDKAGLLNPEKRFELIEGELYEMPIGENHASILMRLNSILVPQFAGRALVNIQNLLRLGEFGLPQPDLALLEPSPDFYAQRHPEPSNVYLLIEIADSTLKYDQEVKLPSYARHGVREVWIVDVAAGQTLVYRNPQGSGYQTLEVVPAGQPIHPSAFPEDAILPL
jgi:Uma2 family endonuclease